MPVVRMPDGTQVRFPDDMPAEQIRGLIASKFPDVVPKAQPEAAPTAGPDETYRGTILPFEKNMRTGETSLAVPGLLKGAYESARAAFTLPGRAMRGEIQMNDAAGNATPEVIGEGLNFALWASPTSVASNLPSKVAPTVKPKPEGLQVAEAAKRLGVDLPRAATSDRVSVQQAGKTLTNIPLGGTPLRKASEQAISQLDDAALRVQQGYGAGNVASAGSAAREGITTHAKEVLPAKVGARYDAVDALVTPNVVTPLTQTGRVAGEILAKRENAKIAGNSQAVNLIRRAVAEKDGLNYQGIKDLRTAIGEFVDDPAKIAASGVSAQEIKRIYGALTDDLRNAVQRSGGDDAVAAFERANTYAAKKFAERADLQKVLGKQASDEGIFAKIEAMAGSTSRADQNGLLKVRGAVGKEGWDEISSAVISKMGRDADGRFSPDRFLTSYGKLSPSGKSALFRTTGKKDLANSLDDLAIVSRRFKQLNQFANPSGTAQSAITGAAGFGILAEPTTTISTVVGSRVLSNILAKPTSAKKLAQWAKAYEQAAVKPGVQTQALLEARAKVLAIDLAAETGAPSAVKQITQAISGVGRVPAEPQDNGNGAQEYQGDRPQGQPRMLLPNEA